MFMEGGLKMERIATFYHTYSKIPNVPKGKRGRDSTSPTGKTPQHKSKKQLLKDPTLSRIHWSEEEKDFLNTYVLVAGGVPATRVNPFWNDCTKKLNKHCGSSRTGVMCRSRYQKVKKLFPVGTTQGIQTETFSLIKETQTDPALPVIEKQSSSHYLSFINIPHSTIEQQTGAEKFLPKKQKILVFSEAQHDRVKHYAHNVLQLGLLYMQFLDVCQIPYRSRLLTTLKYMMAVFKAVNSHSKYALEILRFLAHQQASYSLHTANKSLYGLFVNTEGKIDSHTPADLQMEHIVRKIKKLVKNVGSNKIMGTISRKSRTLAGMSHVAEQYDHAAGVIVRAQLHKKKKAFEEEMIIIKDLRDVRPFKTQIGRVFHKFEKILALTDGSLSQQDYEAWIQHHKFIFDYETGK